MQGRAPLWLQDGSAWSSSDQWVSWGSMFLSLTSPASYLAQELGDFADCTAHSPSLEPEPHRVLRVSCVFKDACSILRGQGA